MNITPIATSLLLAGIPAFAGMYFIVGYFGYKKVSTGVSGLVFGITLGIALMYFMPEGRISRGDYTVTVPWVLGVCIAFGALSGFITRSRNKVSKKE